MQFTKLMAEVFQRVPGEWAGKAAIDIALMDWVGQKLGIPLYSLFRARPGGRAGHHVFHRHRHARDHQAEDARGRGLPGAQSEGGAGHRRGHHRSRSQRDQEAAARGRQRRLEGQGRGRPQDQLAGEAGRGVHRAADAGGACSKRRGGCAARIHMPVIADEACQHADRYSEAQGSLRRRQHQAGQERRHAGGATA